ncbi:UNKNOWN [Stylonychia lemnae]|uniref:Uncharacterized protein n=1 Tax=Stylonychia lemnae TaxID=5949 RepID=A0A078B665_STYLE|nr:UNKNOWN [Stylonychia lemnae]|eukprot:CDW88802.1 UNKNOWN [Stylonychia lemnae]
MNLIELKRGLVVAQESPTRYKQRSSTDGSPHLERISIFGKAPTLKQQYSDSSNHEEFDFQDGGLDERYNMLGKIPEQPDSDRNIDSQKQFLNNQIKIQRQLLQNINKDEITRLLENLCKDFLNSIIKHKAYDIKMSLIDIINLPKEEYLIEGEGSAITIAPQTIIKNQQAQKFKLSLYQDEIDELKSRLAEEKSEKDKYFSKFVQAKDTNKDLQQMISQMRATYTKELQNLRDSLILKQQNKNFQYTEVRFFDTTETMDEGTKTMLNMKIQDMQRLYEDQIRQQQDKLEIFQRQIIMFEKLCEDGNMLVSLDELNAFSITKKLAIVEKDPKILWKALEDVFGFGFFHPTIEEEFGITPAFKEQITKQFNEELNKARHESQSKVSKFAGSVKNELELFRRIIGRKNQEISLVQSAQQSKYEVAVLEYKEKTQEVHEEAMNLKTKQCLDRIGFKISGQLKKIEIVADLKDKIETQTEKLTEHVRKYQGIKAKCQLLEKTNNYYKYMITQQSVQIESNSNKVQEVSGQLRIQEQDFNLKLAAFEEQRYYINLLEKELDRLNTLFKRMSVQNPNFVFFQQNPIQGLEQLRLKVKNEMNNKTFKTMSKVLKDHNREKFTMTDMMDLNQEIQFKPSLILDQEYKFVQGIDTERGSKQPNAKNKSSDLSNEEDSYLLQATKNFQSKLDSARSKDKENLMFEDSMQEQDSVMINKMTPTYNKTSLQENQKEQKIESIATQGGNSRNGQNVNKSQEQIDPRYGRLNKSVESQGGQIKNTRTSHNNIQVQVQPKYELVSFNLRVFEKMLNRKLGLERVSIGIQTDQVQENVNNTNKDSHPIINIRTSNNKRLLNKSQKLLQNNRLKQSVIFSKKHLDLEDDYRLQNEEVQLQYDDGNYPKSLSKSFVGQGQNFIRDRIRYKNRNQTFLNSSIGETTENYSEERLNESKYEQDPQRNQSTNSTILEGRKKRHKSPEKNRVQTAMSHQNQHNSRNLNNRSLIRLERNKRDIQNILIQHYNGTSQNSLKFQTTGISTQQMTILGEYQSEKRHKNTNISTSKSNTNK